jgi:two-component system response regulator HydG
MPDNSEPLLTGPAMQQVKALVAKAAKFNVPVLILGESGTGKEVVADLIHKASAGAKGPHIKVNCGALPRELVESELFGNVKGAFTGASVIRKGLFRDAEGGTIFLDELAEMPMDAQVKLLRVLQEKQIRAVGGTESHPFNARIITATNRNIRESIITQTLREDLYYRINTVEIKLPPLRDRREEIVPLARHFLKSFSAQHAITVALSQVAEEKLVNYPWPGNVRQLQAVVHRAAIFAEDGTITALELDLSMDAVPTDFTAEAAERKQKIIDALRAAKGNKVSTAKTLGVSRGTLYTWMKSFNITEEIFYVS